MNAIQTLADGWLSPADLQEQYAISKPAQAILRLKNAKKAINSLCLLLKSANAYYIKKSLLKSGY